jgi:hypothetical protein
MIEDAAVLGLATLPYRDRGRPALLLYAPLGTFFKSYLMRFVRVAADLDELIFRRSYRDGLYPTKVRNRVEQS